MKRILLALPALLLVLFACTDPFLNQKYIEPTDEDLENSNAAYLKKHSDEFSLWIDLLKYADLYNALNDASTTATVFAPTNKAVEDFLAWKGVTSIRELDKDYVRCVAQVHILNYNLLESSFITYVESGIIPIPTIFGTYLTTSYGYVNKEVDDVYLINSKRQDTVSIYLNNQARIKTLAKTTANGEIYTLDHVIHPLAESIPQVLKGLKEYGIFLDAIERTGLKDSFSVYADTVYNLNGSFSVNDVRYTSFAVPDSIYHLSGIHSVEDLSNFLSAGTDYNNIDNKLHQYVSYHFLGKSYPKATLFNFQTKGQVVLFDTHLYSQVMTTADDSIDGLVINKDVKIIRSDIQARNGYIHKVNSIMPVYSPEPVTVRWDFCNSADIQSFANAYGAVKNLGDIFTNALTGKEVQVDLSADQLDGNYGTLTSFTYKANTAKSSTKTYRKVGFLKCMYLSSTYKTVNNYGAVYNNGALINTGAYMNNLLVLNLGYAGWIQFKTPTIVKGKYKVVIHYASSIGMKTNFYSSGSLTKFNLDDFQKSIYIYKGLPAKFTDPNKQSNANATGIAQDVIWDQVEFSTSSSHTFKATIMDINAKTNGVYRQLWDFVEFIPIQ